MTKKADARRVGDPEIAKARVRLRWAEETLYDMLHGEKPALNPDESDQSWLYKQMTRMYRAGFLCEEPKSYVMLAGEVPEEVLLYKGITTREPLPKQLTSEANDLGKLLSERQIENYKVFGVDPSYRYYQDNLDQLQDADCFVLTKGGIAELYQFVRFLRLQDDAAIETGDKHVILQNDNGYWKHVVAALGDFLNEVPNCTVTDTRHDTCEILENVLGADKSKKAGTGTMPEILTPGSTVFFVTGNRKKVLDYKKVFNRRGTDVECRWFQQLFDKPEGADERSYSYTGNLLEKLDKFYRHVRDFYGPAAFREALESKGFDLDKAVAWFDDSGLETEENLTDGEEFENCSYRVNPYKSHGPGAELKNVINAMQNQPFDGVRGTRGLFRRMESVFERRYQEKLLAGEETPKVSTLSWNRGTAMIVPLKQFVTAIENGASFEEMLDQVPAHFLQSRTEDDLIFSPRPDVRAVDSKNFLVPRHDPERRTKAENPHYIPQHSITAQLVKAAARTIGFVRYEKRPDGLTAHFTRQAGQSWRIGTQQSIHAGITGSGLPKKDSRALKGHYNLQHGNGGRFDVSRLRVHELPCEDGTSENMPCALNNFYNFTLRADGFLLTPDHRKLKGEESFWSRTFTFFSLIVGRQINDKAVTSKPLLVMDCPTWRPYIKILETYAGGLIPEMPDEILDGVVAPGENLRQKMDEAFAEYHPDQVPSYNFIEDGQTCPDDLFCVTVYCSASTTDYPMKMWARDFSFDCGALGFAVKNGGGTGPDGLMIETSEGVRMVKEGFDAFLKGQGLEGAPKTHVASIQCVDTAQEEGLCKFNDYWAVYPTIYQRMHELQNAHAEVVLPGGAGTIQEIAASVLMRRAGIYETQNRPLIIVNHQGIYDPFLKMIPKDDFDKYNIQVVDQASQALDLLLEARRAQKMEPALPYSKEEYVAHKKEFMRQLRRQDQHHRHHYNI